MCCCLRVRVDEWILAGTGLSFFFGTPYCWYGNYSRHPGHFAPVGECVGQMRGVGYNAVVLQMVHECKSAGRL